MKTWTIPAIEDLEIKLTAAKASKNHCEEHWGHGQGAGAECTPECSQYKKDDGQWVS